MIYIKIYYNSKKIIIKDVYSIVIKNGIKFIKINNLVIKIISDFISIIFLIN